MTEQMKYGDSMAALLPHRAAELSFYEEWTSPLNPQRSAHFLFEIFVSFLAARYQLPFMSLRRRS
jgi:hypothetical protein